MRRAALSSILLATALLSAGCRRASAPPRSDGESASSQQDGSAVHPAEPISQDAPRASSTASANPDTRPLLVCFGDSLTAGYGTDLGESYPDVLQRDLDQARFAYHVVNAGISGNTTKDGLDRVDRVIALHPALIVVELGGNDGLRGLPVEDTRGNLDAILSALTKSGSKIALAGITLPPDYGPDYILKFNAIYPDLARKYRIPLLPFLLQGVFGVDGMMQADRTHATARGNQVVANNVLQLIKPMLKH